MLSHYDTVTVGETPHVKDLDRVLKWVHPARRELRMCFQFEFHDLDGDIQVPLIPKKWELPDMKACVNKWQSYMHARGGWNSNYLENHDQARSVSRWGNDSPEFRKSSAKMLALFHASLGGTIYVYQGQELGMKNIPEDWPIEDVSLTTRRLLTTRPELHSDMSSLSLSWYPQYLDVATKNYYRECSEATSAGRPSPTPAQVLQWASIKSRDCARTPVQWDASPNAGFTTGKPWMRVNDDYREWNAEQQSHDADSVRAFWKRMLRLRKGCRPLVYGNFNLLEPTNPKLFAYVRNLEGSPSVLVVLNFSDGDLDMTIDPDAAKTAQKDLEYKAAGELADLSALETRAKLVIGTHEAELKATDANGFKGQSTTLKAREGRLYTLAK